MLLTQITDHNQQREQISIKFNYNYCFTITCAYKLTASKEQR